MSEIVHASAVRFDSLSAIEDGYTLLSINGKVCKSDKPLSEMIQSAVDSEHFATKEWVNDQGFLKEHQSLDGYAKESWVSTNYYNVDETNDFLDEKYDTSAFENVSGTFATKNWVEEQNYITGVDLSNYYTKSETSGKTEISAALEIKQDLIQNKKDSSIPYLETSSSNPSWEVIESEQINAHGTAEEGKTYTIAINDRPYKTVCIGGKLWLAENYIDDSHALYTDEDYGSYFMANTISQYIPQGWHLPSKEEWESLQNAHSDELEKLFSTDWHTDPNNPEYIQCTNELKLNLTPGGYYNRNTSEVLQKGYNSYYATSTYEVLSQSSQQQRVYVKLTNYVDLSNMRKSQMISFDWDGSRKADSSYPGNIRLIKDDLDVSGPDCWKTFKGKNFMAIADNEGNTFKDFYLKKVEAQATYQPIGSYASSAGVETLNTYYALTTTGWKDIAEGFYDKTSINNSLGLKQDNLTFAGEDNTITAINSSAVGGGASTYNNGYLIDIDSNNNINIRNKNCSAKSDNYAYAFGINTTANNSASFAIGCDTKANSNYTFAEGSATTANDQCAHAEGCLTNAGGFGSHAEGKESIANGSHAHAEGYKTRANGQYAHAEGAATSATNSDAHAEGNSTLANGYESHAEGLSTTAGHYSHAEGIQTSANGNGGNPAHAEGIFTTAATGAHSEGYHTLASGGNASYVAAHAEGYYTTALEVAHAEGANTYASGNYQGPAHAEGYQTSAIGYYSHAEGRHSLANTYCTHAEGYYTSAIGNYTHTEGAYSLAKGQGSHTEGYYTSATGQYSHSEGYYTIAGSNFMHAQGKCNKTSADVAFVIGNGNINNNVITPSDAFIVDWNGNVTAAGNLYTSLNKQVITDVRIVSGMYNGGVFEEDEPTSFVQNGIADITPIYNYIQGLEVKIKQLETIISSHSANWVLTSQA